MNASKTSVMLSKIFQTIKLKKHRKGDFFAILKSFFEKVNKLAFSFNILIALPFNCTNGIYFLSNDKPGQFIQFVMYKLHDMEK